MPNLAHPLFSAPIETIDTAMVQGFLDLQVAESFTVDYKRGVDAAPETVAAMANSYGGLVLIGVDTHATDENLPGDLVGVKVSDKDRLVSKMFTTFDPPGWTPDVILVPVNGRQLLVLRVDPDSVPRPLFHKGVVRVRLDGRNTIADRRLVHTMFHEADNPVPVYTGDPRFVPARHVDIHAGLDEPDLVIRAAAARPLRGNTARLRLRGATIDALRRSLSGSSEALEGGIHPRQRDLAVGVNTHRYENPWTVDPKHGHGRYVRLTAGHRLEDRPRPIVQLECTVQLADGGGSLHTFFDLLFWCAGRPVPSEVWVQAAYEAPRALVVDVLPTLTEQLLGTSSLPTPAVELHIAPGKQAEHSLVGTLNTDCLGPQLGSGPLRRASEYLAEELVASGDIAGAVTEALHNVALDWRYLNPGFPPLCD